MLRLGRIRLRVTIGRAYRRAERGTLVFRVKCERRIAVLNRRAVILST